MIINDSKAKYFNPNKSLEQVLIENCPMKDYEFTEICEAYGMPEEETMDCMVQCKTGSFGRTSDGWFFQENED